MFGAGTETESFNRKKKKQINDLYAVKTVPIYDTKTRIQKTCDPTHVEYYYRRITLITAIGSDDDGEMRFSAFFLCAARSERSVKNVKNILLAVRACGARTPAVSLDVFVAQRQ